MKLAYITHFAPIPSRKADPVCVMKTCSALQRNGIEVNLVIPDGQGEPLSSLSEDKDIWSYYGITDQFTINYLPGKSLYRLGKLGRLIYKFWSVFYTVIVNKIRILHVRHVEIAWLGILLGARVILEHHQIDLMRSSWFFPLLLRYTQRGGKRLAFIVITQAAKNSLISLRIPDHKILVAPMGVDLKLFTQLQPDKAKLFIPFDKTIIGFSGSLYPGRGIEELIGAAEQFPDLFFGIVGGSPEDIGRCQNYAQQQKVGNIHFVGFVPQKVLNKYLFAFDILIMPYTTRTPTHRDMSPMKLFEYMAVGKPIVATDFPVIREILHDKVNAVLVAPDSSAALVEGIRWCLENPDEARQMGLQARRDVEQYTWDKRAERITTWFEKILIT